MRRECLKSVLDMHGLLNRDSNPGFHVFISRSMMLMIVAALLLATPALCDYRVLYQQREPEEIEFERSFKVKRRDFDTECPPRAICGVAYDFNRTVGDRRLPERRVIIHCTCPGNVECPIVPEHRIFASLKRREYLCQPRAAFTNCDLNNSTGPAAKQLLERHLEDVLTRYFRINCICPRHDNPVFPQGPRDLELATSIRRVYYNQGLHTTFHDRRCIQ
ncbi:uncharacterized protein LOC124292336 isoform X2 [Haliotis rubra]|uniref:uncharacterized protein LOC124292336 isoform X2 n=1 Tax=Haliotis rubra TaxID=36100 RepID=UPI001EE5C2E8|nr:uncharacterized protein LOC124292336 isoform X2 [Haliotis rubra]